MKLSDLEEVRQIAEKLDRIKAIREWLDNFPSRGLQLYSNGTVGTMIEIPHSSSTSLLDDAEANCLARLKELGVES